MDLKERVQSLASLMEELEQRKKDTLEELLQTVEYAEKEELTQEFIDWYYWDSGFSSLPLSVALKCPSSKLASLTASKPKDILPCIRCKKDKIPLVYKSKSGRIGAIKEYKGHLHSFERSSYFFYEKCPSMCKECKRELHDKEAATARKRDTTYALKRVKKYGRDLDLENMPYQEYLQTEYWKRFAHNARKRAGYHCQKCGRGNTLLDVHHLTYERRGKEWYSDVAVLCRHCHSVIHGKEPAL